MTEFHKMNKEELIKLLEELQVKLRDMEADGEAKRLVHELQVHQVELEMQNRDLLEARAQIEDARDRYAELYDFAPVGYVILDEKGVITEINLTGASMLGKERSNILGRPFPRYLDRKDITSFMHILKECRDKGDKEIAELGLVKDGAVLHVQVVCVPAVDSSTGEKVVRAALTDISERKKAEALSIALAGERATRAESEKARKKVEESEATYRAIGEAIPFGVWTADIDGRMEYFSRSFLDMLGRGLDECRGIGWTDCLSASVAESVRTQWQECIRGGIFCDMEYKVKGADDRFYDILLRGIPIRDEKGRIIRWAGTNIDITIRKRFEEELLKIRKLESLGTLAAGIAHEFSNLLASIRGNIELALDDMSGGDAVERLVEAENIIDAAKVLSTQLRTYVAGVKPFRELAYIDDILKTR